MVKIEPDNDPASNPSIMQRNDGERIGGEKGYHRSLWTRGQELRVAYRDNEIRIDTNHSDLTSLQSKYAKEFALAEKRQKERQSSWSETWRMNVKYDYDNDPMFKTWCEDKERAREVLHIHYLDDWLDDPLVLITHSMKATTAIGGLQGMYRAFGMWKTIDQHYAKLNGLTFRSLLIQETALGILRGTAMGVWCGFGMLVGDNLYRVVSALYVERTVARDRRRWQGVTTAMMTGFFFMSGFGAWLMRDMISRKAQAIVTACGTSLGLMAGLGVGYFIYKPFQDAHPDHQYDTPSWRPWNERSFQFAGPPGIRGRYV